MGYPLISQSGPSINSSKQKTLRYLLTLLSFLVTIKCVCKDLLGEALVAYFFLTYKQNEIESAYNHQ